MKSENYPPHWDENRVKRVIDHYENQSEDDAVEEDERAFQTPTETIMEVPTDLVPIVREMIAQKSA
ncbi:MAG: hypothetical protein KIT45_09940 [Fimbriimonadia bacterium]|nr:hypothetical protein [Fimbriimonadia bacterium]